MTDPADNTAPSSQHNFLPASFFLRPFWRAGIFAADSKRSSHLHSVVDRLLVQPAIGFGVDNQSVLKWVVYGSQ